MNPNAEEYIGEKMGGKKILRNCSAERKVERIDFRVACYKQRFVRY